MYSLVGRNARSFICMSEEVMYYKPVGMLIQYKLIDYVGWFKRLIWKVDLKGWFGKLIWTVDWESLVNQVMDN